MPKEYPAPSSLLTDDIEPFSDPLGDSHHSDIAATNDDRTIADKLAWYMGDLFLNSYEMAPTEQWTQIVKALRIHGLRIVNRAHR